MFSFFSRHSWLTRSNAFSKVKQYDTAINGCCPHVAHSQQSCFARVSWPEPRLCGKQEAVLSQIYVQGIMNMPFNDFANTYLLSKRSFGHVLFDIPLSVFPSSRLRTLSLLSTRNCPLGQFLRLQLDVQLVPLVAYVHHFRLL